MSRVVYSTETGRLCPHCSHPVADCQCQKQQNNTISGDGTIRILRETKGRKGKGVSLITGLPLTASELKKLAKEIKQRCGAGGAVKGGIVEIQSDQREIIQQLLKQKGYDAKISGG
jgi:translation initiation factor 1